MISTKATILCVYEILKKYSDENHILSADKIKERLKTLYDVDMDRRTVYRNIAALKSMGIEIEGYTDNKEGYYLIDRTFEPSEVRLLCDAVASSDVIKEEQSKDIIKKLIETQSLFQGRMLQKTVFVKSEQKVMNRQLFYNIDALNIAISQGCKVMVRLLEYDLELELTEKENATVIISPYATLWAAGNYYIIAKDDGTEQLTHYRIDLLRDIRMLEQSVDMIFGGINPTQYAEKFISRRGEETERFTLECDRNLWQALAERFGKEITVIKEEKEQIRVKVRSIPSEMHEWVMTHMDDCEVISPKAFREEMQEMVMRAYKKYLG